MQVRIYWLQIKSKKVIYKCKICFVEWPWIFTYYHITQCPPPAFLPLILKQIYRQYYSDKKYSGLVPGGPKVQYYRVFFNSIYTMRLFCRLYLINNSVKSFTKLHQKEWSTEKGFFLKSLNILEDKCNKHFNV